MAMRLVMELADAPIEIVGVREDGAYPWLLRVGELALAARASHLEGVGATEAPTLTVELDNWRRQAANLLGRPLRARATVYDDDDSEFWRGLVSGIGYGPTLSLTIDA